MRRLSIVALVAVILLAIAAPAQAGCGDAIRDEFLQTGAVAGTYAPECYQDALENLPADVREYTDAEDVIRAAMARDAGTGATAAVTAEPVGETTTTAVAAVPPADGDDGGIPAAVLVLGGVSLVLVVLGIAGVVMRRARRT